MDDVTVKCPFCDRLFLMTRPLFVAERERTACPSCRGEAERNTEDMIRERRARREAARKSVPS